MFKNELFLILGMLFAKYFPAYIYNFGVGISGGGVGYGGGGGRGKPNWSTNLRKAQTGRGGIITSKSPSDGENGRPGATDNSTGPSDIGMSGFGATVVSAGDGFHPGGFGYGGKARTERDYAGDTKSAGGGSGWFGGGSSFMDAGGGGGSSWCYSDTDEGLEGLSVVDNYNPPPWLQFADWIGYSSSTKQYFDSNYELFLTNTRHLQEYESLESSLGAAFSAFCALHQRANGNGLILISEVNKQITIDRVGGTIDNIAQVIEYSGSSVQWTPPEAGRYEFILWGAQGGTVMYTLPGMQGLTYQQYTGGFGGAIGLFIDLPTTFVDDEFQTRDVVIDCCVGQEGSLVKGVESWNGGGNGSNSTGGGGATDLRFESNVGTSWAANLGNRFAVAGGGGGCIGTGSGGYPQAPFKEPSWSSANNGDGNTIVFPDPDYNEGPQYYLVNDRSIVYVDISYFTQSEIDPGTKLNCRISIDNGREGSLSQDFEIQPVSGFVELAFPLDQIYPPNTDTHWVTITAEISGLDELTLFEIPNAGVVIRVETQAGVNESNSNTDYSGRTLFVYKIDNIDFGDIVNVNLTEEPPVGDLYVKHVDTIDLTESVNILLKTVEYVHLSALESFDAGFDSYDAKIKNVVVEYLKSIESFDAGFDSYGAKIKNIVFDYLKAIESLNFDDAARAYNDLPSGDILIEILDKLNFIDAVKYAIKQVTDGYSNGLESLDSSDCANVHTVSVQVVHISNLESMNFDDSANIYSDSPAEDILVGILDKLDFIDAANSRIKQITDGSSNGFDSLDSSDCANVHTVNVQVEHISNLESLDSSDCANVHTVNVQVVHISNLESIDITDKTDLNL